MAISNRTLALCQRMIGERLQTVNDQIATKTGEEPDIVDTQWFDDKQRQRDALKSANDELHREFQERKKERQHAHSR